MPGQSVALDLGDDDEAPAPVAGGHKLWLVRVFVGVVAGVQDAIISTWPFRSPTLAYAMSVIGVSAEHLAATTTQLVGDTQVTPEM